MNDRSSMIDARHHQEPFTVDGVVRAGMYLDVPVLIVRDEGDGFVVALWPDRLNPGRSHGRAKPFLYDRGQWWRVWGEQITDASFEYAPPEFPLTLAPKPVPDDA